MFVLADELPKTTAAPRSKYLGNTNNVTAGKLTIWARFCNKIWRRSLRHGKPHESPKVLPKSMSQWWCNERVLRDRPLLCGTPSVWGICFILTGRDFFACSFGEGRTGSLFLGGFLAQLSACHSVFISKLSCDGFLHAAQPNKTYFLWKLFCSRTRSIHVCT